MSQKRLSRSKPSSQADPSTASPDPTPAPEGEEVHLADKAKGQVIGNVVTVEDSIIGIIHSDAIQLNNSVVGIASSQKPVLQGVIGVSLGQDTVLSDSRTGVVIARDVKSDHIQSVLLIASKVDGPVEVLVDHRSIAIFGIAVGFTLGVLFSLFRLFRGR